MRTMKKTIAFVLAFAMTFATAFSAVGKGVTASATAGGEDFKVKVEVGILDTSVKTVLKESSQVFIDNQDNLRFFGANVDNYIKVDDSVYRIIGLFGDKLRVIGDPLNTSIYNADKTYLSVSDYLLSFDEHELDESNITGHNSWLNIDNRYWLESDQDDVAKMVDADVGVRTDSKYRMHFQRIVSEIDGTGNVLKGNGTMSSPYEVSYGSK